MKIKHNEKKICSKRYAKNVNNKLLLLLIPTSALAFADNHFLTSWGIAERLGILQTDDPVEKSLCIPPRTKIMESMFAN